LSKPKKKSRAEMRHQFPLSEGISRHAIERHAEESIARSPSAGRRSKRRPPPRRRRSRHPAQSPERDAKREGQRAAKFRNEELALRRQLRETEEAKKNQDVDISAA